jgi:hypothetical protein
MTDIGIISNGDVVAAVSGGLGRTFAGTGNAVKMIATRTRRNAEAIRNWVEGRNAPRAAELIELCREFDEVWEEVCRLAGRMPPENRHAHAERLLDELAERLHAHRQGRAA